MAETIEAYDRRIFAELRASLEMAKDGNGVRRWLNETRGLRFGLPREMSRWLLSEALDMPNEHAALSRGLDRIFEVRT